MPSAPSTIKSKAVRAGAGAGKTYNLTVDVAAYADNFFKKHERWPRVVVTTFTKKATQELSERLVQKAIEENREILPFVNSSYYLQVSTIHGILDKLIKDCGALIGLRSDFTYLSTADGVFLSKKVLRSILSQEAGFNDLIDHLSFSYVHDLLYEAVHQPLEEHTCITRQDILQLIAEDLNDCHQQLEHIFDLASQEPLTPSWKNTIDILQKVAPLLSAGEWRERQEQMERLIEDIRLPGGKVKADSVIAVIRDDIKSVVHSLREFCKPQFRDSALLLAEKYNYMFAELLNTYRDEFHKAKTLQNQIEIADLEIYALKLIQQYPEPVAQFANQYDYWVIDEFQDTSPLQVVVLEALIHTRPYYIVGDPQQSIYLFRGARSEVFHRAIERIQSHHGEYQELKKNYRSEVPMLAVINQLASSLGPHFSKMEAAKEETDKKIALYIKPECGADEELSALRGHIASLIEQGASFADIAILVRKNSQLTEIGRYLARHQIPVHLSSSGQFWRRREIYDCLILLKFMLNPYDEVNLVSLLRMPFIACTNEDIVLWRSQEGNLWEKVKEQEHPANQTLQQILEFARISGYVQGFIESLHFLKMFDLHLQYDPTGRSEGNIWMFIEKLKNFAIKSGSFFDFISECERAEFFEPTSDAVGSVETNKVVIMTIHASKGLQFPHVLMPYLGSEQYIENKKAVLVDEEKRKWSIRVPHSLEEVATSSSLIEKKVLRDFKLRLQEEDLRLFYVAMTRAINSIYASWDQTPKTESWSRFFSNFNLTPGLHVAKDFSYQVYDETICQKLFSGTDKPPINIPSPYTNEVRLLEKTSVTQMTQSAQYRQTDKNFFKIRRGILFHRLLEVLTRAEEVNVAQTIHHFFADHSDEAAQALNYVLQLKEPPMTELLKVGRAEWSFVSIEEGSSIEGQVDLWGIVNNTLWIVDYKSGEYIDQSKLSAQIVNYSVAVKKYLKWTGPVEMALVFPFLQKSLLMSC
ncbi:MAG: UvrD-helicase domain-containing protein [Bdellovibrionaceae bacterium]|nr:UvrD-helicase domain-containing protein [Pseudobdellovibrionaceae bacterium]